MSRQVAKATANHQKHPLQLKKKFGGGKSQKIKGFFWWGAARLAVLGGAAGDCYRFFACLPRLRSARGVFHRLSVGCHRGGVFGSGAVK